MAKVELATVVACTPSGIRIDAEQKAWIHDCESVLWEVRRLLQPVFHRRKVLDLSHIIRDNRQAWMQAFDMLAISPGLFDSLESLRRRDVAPSALHHSEYSMSTDAVLAVLILMSNSRHRVEEKELCLHLAAGFLTTTCPAQVLVAHNPQFSLLLRDIWWPRPLLCVNIF